MGVVRLKKRSARIEQRLRGSFLREHSKTVEGGNDPAAQGTERPRSVCGRAACRTDVAGQFAERMSVDLPKSGVRGNDLPEYTIQAAGSGTKENWESSF